MFGYLTVHFLCKHGEEHDPVDLVHAFGRGRHHLVDFGLGRLLGSCVVEQQEGPSRARINAMSDTEYRIPSRPPT